MLYTMLIENDSNNNCYITQHVADNNLQLFRVINSLRMRGKKIITIKDGNNKLINYR